MYPLNELRGIIAPSHSPVSLKVFSGTHQSCGATIAAQLTPPVHPGENAHAGCLPLRYSTAYTTAARRQAREVARCNVP